MIRIRNHDIRLMLGALLVAAIFGYVRSETASSANTEAAARLQAETAALRR